MKAAEDNVAWLKDGSERDRWTQELHGESAQARQSAMNYAQMDIEAQQCLLAVVLALSQSPYISDYTQDYTVETYVGVGPDITPAVPFQKCTAITEDSWIVGIRGM